MGTDRAFELVLWGATGFTGRLVAESLAARELTPPLRWALAGRNRAKLEAIRDSLGLPDLPLIEADSLQRSSLDALCAQTGLVVTTVGPYARYGSELVAACAASGTDCVDLTGEAQWIRAMIDAHHERAQQTGARIVHCCGFDSIPSDLGCWFLQREAKARFGAPCEDVRLRVRRLRGGVSGGTAASMLEIVKTARTDRAVRRVLADPYSLYPAGVARGKDKRDPLGASHDPSCGWTGPFLMAPINTRIVRRTNALLDFPYGKDFRYGEATCTGKGVMGWARAQGLAAGLAGFMTAATLAPSLVARLLPSPGDGPDEASREAGGFTLDLYGQGVDAQGHPFELAARVDGRRDPGYGATARMLSEAALCLARDDVDCAGGSWTPAACMRDALLERLPRADVTFSLKKP